VPKIRGTVGTNYFRASADSFHIETGTPFVAQLLSTEIRCAKQAIFDSRPARCSMATDFRKMRAGSLPRLSARCGLMAVRGNATGCITLFMGGGLADLPQWSAIAQRPQRLKPRRIDGASGHEKLV